MRRFAPTFLRIGMSLVVIWFGLQQATDARSWIDYLPVWSSKVPLSSENFIILNGSIQIILGGLMLFGLYVRFTAFLLALSLFEMAYTAGYNPTGVRDFALTIGIFTVFLWGKDKSYGESF